MEGFKLSRAFCGSWIHSALLGSITAAQNRAVFWLSPLLLIFRRPRACLAGGRRQRGLPGSLPRLLCSSQHPEKTSLEDGSSWLMLPTDGTRLLEGEDGTPRPPSCLSLLPRFASTPLREQLSAPGAQARSCGFPRPWEEFSCSGDGVIHGVLDGSRLPPCVGACRAPVCRGSRAEPV